MPATTSDGMDPTGIQCRDDLVNAEVNTLDAPVDRHADLIFEGYFTTRGVAILTGCFIPTTVFFGHYRI